MVNKMACKVSKLIKIVMNSVKRTVLKKGIEKPAQIRGIWKGVDFSDEEIEEAKSSWLKTINDFNDFI